MLGGAVGLVDPVLDGGFARAARAAAAVEPVGRGSRVVKEEEAGKRPREREEEGDDAYGSCHGFVLMCVMEHGQNIDDRG